MTMPELLRQFQNGIKWAQAGDGRSFRFELSNSGFPRYYYHDAEAHVSLVNGEILPGFNVAAIERKVNEATRKKEMNKNERKNNQAFNHKQRFGNQRARATAGKA